jgi:lipopolysaccharide transport system ATP-binding protein
MSSAVIRAEKLSKMYRIGAREQQLQTRAGAFKRAAFSPIAYLRRTLSPPNEEEIFWALRDISFEVQRGEAVGIIGRNGAGKSTLLKILSRITEPTSGKAVIKGRVGSLLEVGTGFHPELTGRENIFLNGTIMGMRRSEIQRKFDEIVDFSGVEKFIDTPVKHYSSGMYIRLAFAIAAHMEPEILIVDEVLAVGDAQFQKKCLGKMEDVGKQGRTVLFVSHNAGAINRLCNTCIQLNNGTIVNYGPSQSVVNLYIQGNSSNKCAEAIWHTNEPGDDIKLKSVKISQVHGTPTSCIDIEKPFAIQIGIEVHNRSDEIAVALRVLSSDGQIVIHTACMLDKIMQNTNDKIFFSCLVPAHLLNIGTYTLSVGSDIPYKKIIFQVDNVLTWDIESSSPEMGRYEINSWKGVIGPGLTKWVSSPVAE